MALKEEVCNDEMLFDCSNQIENYTCKACSDFQTNILTSLKHHTGNEHRNNSPEVDFYKCLKCLFVTYSKYLMGWHSLLSECATRSKYERNKRFVCYSINGQSQSSFSLEEEPETLSRKKRKNTQTLNSIYCGQCPYKCKLKNCLVRHIKSNHPDSEHNPWFQCAQCPDRFEKRRNWKRHLIARHTEPENIRWHHCPHCTYKSKQGGNLKEHVISRHRKPEDIQWFQCERCPSKFKLKRILQNHVIAQHTSPEDIRWYDCPHCPHRCKENGNLKKHIMSRHTDPGAVPGYDCPHCSHKSKRNEHLKRHIQARHC